MKEFIEIPFGAKDSELEGWEYNIPEGYTASIENGKIIVKKEKSEDEKIRDEICIYIGAKQDISLDTHNRWLAWLEKQDPKKHKEELENAYKTADEVQYKRGYEDAVKEMEKQGESSDKIHYWTEEEIEPIISDYLRGAEHYGGMIARLRCLKPKSLEKQGEQKPVDFKAKDWYVSKVDGKIYNAKFMEKTPNNQARRLEIEKAAISATGIIEREEWFIKGAEWADSTAWKPADGDNLPEIDREVIAIIIEYGYYKTVFAHRPNPNGDAIRYDKGEWNLPNVIWWLDSNIEKLINNE